MSMSRSFVGSSSSSTFGSPISRRMSCRRRRSPPERSATNVHWRLPPKPKRSHSWPAVSSRPSPSDTRGRIDSSACSTRSSPSSSSRCCESTASRTVWPVLTTPCEGVDVAGQQAQQRRLARAVDAHDADPVARAEAPRDAPQDRALAELDRRVLDVEHRLAEPRRREAQQLGAVARLGLVGDQRVGGVDAEARLRRCAPAGRGAARRAPCAAGCGGAPRSRRRPARARPAPAPRPRSRRRAAGRAPRRPPRCARRRRRGTSDRASRRRPRRGAPRGGGRASRRPRGRGGWSARRAAAAPARRAAAAPAPRAAARRPRAGR